MATTPGNLLGIEVLAGQPGDLRAPVGDRRHRGRGLDARRATPGPSTSGLDPSLVSSPDRVVSFTALDRLGDRLVVAGDEVGPRRRASTSSPRCGWGRRKDRGRRRCCRSPRPATGVRASCPGRPSVACADGAGCWVAGWVRGRPVVWAVAIGGRRRDHRRRSPPSLPAHRRREATRTRWSPSSPGARWCSPGPRRPTCSWAAPTAGAPSPRRPGRPRCCRPRRPGSTRSPATALQRLDPPRC